MPVDPTAPALRGAGILADARVRVVVVAASLAAEFSNSWPGPGPRPRLVIVGDSSEIGPADAAWNEIQADDAPSPLPPPRCIEDLAYILYTSGSTGTPKGVMLSHANACCFLDWCDSALGLKDGDRFSSHAPFHFDLSIFDLYASVRHAGTLVLVGESLGKEPARLASFVNDRAIDVWYSAPSILALMSEHGGLDRHGYRAPRVVLFAGEVFPIRPLRRLRALWPDAALWNLYGPTETNVCTAYPIPQTIAEDRVDPFPIGSVCPPLKARVVSEDGQDVPLGSEGELIISGPGVMRGYFGRSDLNARAFLKDEHGTLWYHTGDLVTDDGSGVFLFRGRRDRMVKKRGYRIELGEIESALYRHDDVERAAVLAKADEAGVSIDAFVTVKPERQGVGDRHEAALHDIFTSLHDPRSNPFPRQLPTTSTDKVDYQGLKQMGED